MKFTNVNLNPSGKKVADCVVRAIVKATGKQWRQVYDALCEHGRGTYTMPNEKKTYEAYLSSLGWVKQRMPRFPDNTRYTVAEFLDANPKKTYIISVARHLTVGVSGELFDTWNCGRKSVGNYWVYENKS